MIGLFGAFVLAVVALCFGVICYMSGRLDPLPLNPPNLRKCALRFDLNDVRGGRAYSYCLNPVDEKTGLAVPFTDEDMDRIVCTQGGAGTASVCDKLFGRSR